MIAQLALLLLYVGLSVFGLFWLKAAPGWTHPSFAMGFVAYAAGFAIWLYMLTRMPLSVIFPIAAGSLIVATQLVGVFFLGERTSPLHLVGVALVVTGIGLIYVRT